ncbi:hypothetical protein C5167_047426 [Papaver somniferum]|uniref:Uncharacterized protein n=1 Tax=Papaver somniferum TaxID=3469 RepID=A0A4Y7LKE1_PAPSO|nr:hypothetical protein C5167_047426 [Papaver somniferum]
MLVTRKCRMIMMMIFFFFFFFKLIMYFYQVIFYGTRRFIAGLVCEIAEEHFLAARNKDV